MKIVMSLTILLIGAHAFACGEARVVAQCTDYRIFEKLCPQPETRKTPAGLREVYFYQAAPDLTMEEFENNSDGSNHDNFSARLSPTSSINLEIYHHANETSFYSRIDHADSAGRREKCAALTIQ